VASGLLAVASVALPVTMLAGICISLRRAMIARTDIIAMLAVLQFSLVLAYWGLLPLRLWA
jgi:hypothetical protein